MTSGASPDDGAEALARRVRDDVLAYGWHASVTDSVGPRWRYTVGLHHTYQHPEIIVFGLAPQTMQTVLEAVVRHVRAGHRFEAGERYDAILVRYACAFEAVERRWLPLYLPDAVAFYGAARFPALQCLWPDRAGRYPTDARCDAGVRGVQRCLFPNAAWTSSSGKPQRARRPGPLVAPTD